MKFLVSLLSLAAVSATTPIRRKAHKKLQKLPDSVEVDSKLGNKIMSHARRLENGDEEVNYSWVQNFSIKFQGCHHISQWNDEADGQEDVRIATKRLVRFRLCPTNTCTLESASGCSEGYGDYVIDMNIYLEAFLDSVDEYNQAKCEYLENMSGCDDENNNNGGNEEYCLYDYYAANGMADICMDENPYQNNYNGNDGDNNFALADYTECAQADLQNANNNNNGRQLENGVEYYMGPYCAEQGGSIYLGLFLDDSCTTFADDYGGKEAYYSLTGRELPYGENNMITMDCYSCADAEGQWNYNDGNNNNNNNQDGDEDNVSEMCAMVYAQAGKCENKLEVNGVYPNYNACSYIQGIQVIRKNGIIVSSGSKANKTASIFIGIFVVAFVLLSAYVYYLKTKLDRATISLDN